MSVRYKRKASPERKNPIKRRRVTPFPSTKALSKRKVQQDGAATTSPAKKPKLAEPTSGDKEQASSSLDAGKGSTSADCSQKRDKTKRSAADQRREFQARYVEVHRLGGGGYGAVFAGYRITDHCPVAIKHIPKDYIPFKVKGENGKRISVEVAIMLKLAAEADGSAAASATVSLLDWFDFGTELILVQERPVPAVDLFDYTRGNGGCLPEEKAKVILKQLVDAAKDLVDKHIFHRDIKSDNILIETGSDVPRVRIIDFGISCFTKKRSVYRVLYGVHSHSPPEFYIRKKYRAGPTTVWQMGVVLYEVLHMGQFNTEMFLQKKLEFNKYLSPDCRNFLDACLTMVSSHRSGPPGSFSSSS